MKSIADVFRTKRQQALSGFDVYILEDGPADGKSPVRSIALDAAANVLRPCLLSVNGDTSEYELTMLLDVYGPLRATEFDLNGTVGGLKGVIGVLDHEFCKVTGIPDPQVFRADRQKALHFGRIA